MRTILVNHLLEPPGRVTGITRFLFALLAALLRLTDDSYVLVTCWERIDLPAELIHPRLQIITRRFWKSASLNALFQNFVIRNDVKSTNAALEFNANPLGAWTGSWPRIVTVHDLYLETMPEAYAPRHRQVWRALFPRVIHSADRVIVPSASTERDLLKGHPEIDGKVVIAPEAPAFAAGSDAAPAPLAVRYGLIVGNLSPNKNVGVLIEALNHLSQRGLDIPLLHIGRDEMGALNEAQAKYPLRVPVVSIQGVDDAALKAAYANAAFFINTSLHEGFCLPVVEAQSCGAPVIASDRSAVPEVAGDGALLIDPTSPEAIADAIASVWSNATLADDLRARGRLNAQRYSWERAATLLTSVFDDVIKSRASATANGARG